MRIEKSLLLMVTLPLFMLPGKTSEKSFEEEQGPNSLETSSQENKIEAHGVGYDGVGEDENGIFLTSNFTLVETHQGSDVTLNCRVKRGSDFGTISWFRHSRGGGVVLISVGDDTYIADSRFAIVRPVLSMNWSLQIRGVQVQDGGQYLCQTSEHPPTSIIVKLEVFEAFADILGSKEKVFRAGTNVQLICLIKDVTQPPAYIFWYHNSRMINYDQGDGVSVEVTGVSNKSMKSILTLDNISMSAAGTYSCSPSMARSDSVNITIKHREQALPEPVVNSATVLSQATLFLFCVLAIF